MAVTIRELAKLAGVSRSTVLRVLQDAPYVRPEVRERVREIASRYAYQLPSAAGAAASSLVGVILPRVNSPFFSSVLSGILSAANAHSCQVIVLENQHDLTSTCLALRLLHQHGVKGVLLASGMADVIPVTELYALWSDEVYVVALDGQPFGNEVTIDYIENDFEELMRTAINYLRHLHHQHIVYLGCSHGAHSMPLPREIIIRRVLSHYKIPFLHVEPTQGTYGTFSDVDTVLSAALAQKPRPTAIIAWSDRLAAMVMQVLQQHGIAVPGDISCLGIGNDPLSEVTFPPLSTVEQLFQKMGMQAMELLTQRMHSGIAPSDVEKQRIVLPAEVIIRDSCARPRLS